MTYPKRGKKRTLSSVDEEDKVDENDEKLMVDGLIDAGDSDSESEEDFQSAVEDLEISEGRTQKERGNQVLLKPRRMRRKKKPITIVTTTRVRMRMRRRLN